MLWRAQVPGQAAQEGLGFPREIQWRSSQGSSPLSQHSTARLSLPRKTPGQDIALTGDPTSSLPSLPPCRQLCCCCHTHSTHLSPRSRAASLSAAASSRTKGFLCLLRGESALLTADRPLSAAPSALPHPQQIRGTWPWALDTSTAPHPLLSSYLIKGKSNTLGLSALMSSASSTLSTSTNPA